MHFYKAAKIFTGNGFLPEGMVLVVGQNGVLQDIFTETSIEKANVQVLEGIITPGFINAHCHLELSHMKGKIPQKTGLPEFGKQIIIQRNNASAEERKEARATADKEMWENGIVAVGDICNNSESFDVKASSNIFYHSFVELIGLHPSRADVVFEAGKEVFSELKKMNLAGSLVPHAPYSTSNELIEKTTDFNLASNLTGTIHSQETDEETKFFFGEENGFYNLYKFLQLDISWFKAPMKRSFEHNFPAFKNQSTIFVHNTITNSADLKLAENKPFYWCFCPNANLYIENRLPNFNLFSSLKNNICFGTDSLASNNQLDLISEANHALKNSSFDLETVLKAMTINAANALAQTENFGALIKGKNTGLNLVQFSNNQLHFTKKLS